MSTANQIEKIINLIIKIVSISDILITKWNKIYTSCFSPIHNYQKKRKLLSSNSLYFYFMEEFKASIFFLTNENLNKRLNYNFNRIYSLDLKFLHFICNSYANRSWWLVFVNTLYCWKIRINETNVEYGIAVLYIYFPYLIAM